MSDVIKLAASLMECAQEKYQLILEQTELYARIAELEADQQWMPIESAPKDGSRIVIANIRYSYTANWSTRACDWSDGKTSHIGIGFDPTHWMPLPKAPEDY